MWRRRKVDDQYASAIVAGLSVFVHVCSGHYGTFPYLEVVCWMRSDGSTSKILSVQPKLGSSMMTTPEEETEYIVEERPVPVDAVKAMALCVDRLSSWPPQIEEVRGEADNSWWMGMTCKIEFKGKSAVIESGGIGFDGTDADVLRELFGRMLDAAGIGDSFARHVLVGKDTD